MGTYRKEKTSVDQEEEIVVAAEQPKPALPEWAIEIIEVGVAILLSGGFYWFIYQFGR